MVVVRVFIAFVLAVVLLDWLLFCFLMAALSAVWEITNRIWAAMRPPPQDRVIDAEFEALVDEARSDLEVFKPVLLR